MPTTLEKTPTITEGRLLRRHSMDELFNNMLAEFGRFWESPFGLWGKTTMRPNLEVGIDWMPRIDVLHEKNEVLVRVDLPGMKKEDIDLRVEDEALILSGERKLETEVEDRETWRMERTYGTFYRRIPLGFDLPADKIKAHFTDGVLELRFPMPEKRGPEPKRVKIA